MDMTRQSRAGTAPAARTGGGMPWLAQRKCACGSGTSSLAGDCAECRARKRGAQTRLALSTPGDVYEREADRVAEQVMRPESRVERPRAAAGPLGTLQREEAADSAGTEEVAAEGEEASEQAGEGGGEGGEAEAEAEDEEDIVADDSGMPKRMGGGSRSGPVPVRLPTGAGQALDEGTRQFMGSRIGHDFSAVRVHTDGEAAASAQRLNAHAYTVGSHVYFNTGRYQPHDGEGRKLLAHELTHVVQQGGAGGPGGTVQRQPARPGRRRAPDTAAGRGRRRDRGEAPACTGACAGPRAPRHDGCNSGSAATGTRRITDLTVRRAAHEVVATWNSGPANTWACSPSTRSGRGGKVPTPLVRNDRVGIKCDQCHTNRHGDGMGWFTGFATRGRAIGFHNSQRVGAAFESHGCVRVSCAVARTIQNNSSSGVTTINVVR